MLQVELATVAASFQAPLGHIGTVVEPESSLELLRSETARKGRRDSELCPAGLWKDV